MAYCNDLAIETMALQLPERQPEGRLATDGH
jgi:hypothetical protein